MTEDKFIINNINNILDVITLAEIYSSGKKNDQIFIKSKNSFINFCKDLIDYFNNLKENEQKNISLYQIQKMLILLDQKNSENAIIKEFLSRINELLSFILRINNCEFDIFRLKNNSEDIRISISNIWLELNH
jgi:hypothetical protein